MTHENDRGAVRRPKRSDLPTRTLLAAVRDHGYDAFDVLCESMPPKVVLAALERDNGRGLLDYGTCMEHSWLTPEGLDALECTQEAPVQTEDFLRRVAGYVREVEAHNQRLRDVITQRRTELSSGTARSTEEGTG